jgi:hypothetical protein
MEIKSIFCTELFSNEQAKGKPPLGAVFLLLVLKIRTRDVDDPHEELVVVLHLL